MLSTCCVMTLRHEVAIQRRPRRPPPSSAVLHRPPPKYAEIFRQKRIREFRTRCAISIRRHRLESSQGPSTYEN